MDHRTVTPIAMDSGIFVEDAHTSTKTSKKPSKGGWSSAIFMIFVEMAERFAYYGLAGNLMNYLMKELRQPMAMAAENVNLWIGLSSIFPVVGAIMADSYLGRYKTILISSIIYFLGMVLMALSVSVVPGHYRAAVFFTALYVLAVGEGGHKPCVQTFAADQFDENLPEEKMAKSSFFNWWYMGIVTGATAGVFFLIYIQDNVGWTQGSLVLAGSVAIALVLFVMGTKRYRREEPSGSSFSKVAYVVVAAIKKRSLTESGDGRDLYYGDKDSSDVAQKDGTQLLGTRSLARTSQMRFLDKAMIIDSIDESNKLRNPWRLCSLNEVEEVKLVFRLVPIWFACIMFTVVQAQAHTFFVKQGGSMNRSIAGSKFQIPAASLQGLIGLTILASALAYDRLFVPLARRFTGHPSGISMLKRIGLGLFVSIINMVVSACIEALRVRVAVKHGLRDNPKATVPLSVWWLLPQYMLVGMSDAFAIIGLQELFYDQVPESMRSMGAAAYISVVGVGSFMSSGIIAIVQAITTKQGHKWLGDNLNTARLDSYYWVLGGMSAVNICLYVFIASRFEYKKLKDEKDERIELGKTAVSKAVYEQYIEHHVDL